MHANAYLLVFMLVSVWYGQCKRCSPTRSYAHPLGGFRSKVGSLWTQVRTLYTLRIADNSGSNLIKIINQQKRFGRRQRGKGGGLHGIRGQVGTIVSGVELRTLGAKRSSNLSRTSGGVDKKATSLDGSSKLSGGKKSSESSGRGGDSGKDAVASSGGRSQRGNALNRWPLHVLIVTQKQQISRGNGLMIKYGEGRGLVVDLKLKKIKGSRVLTPVAKELKRVDFKQDRVGKNVMDELKKYC